MHGPLNVKFVHIRTIFNITPYISKATGCRVSGLLRCDAVSKTSLTVEDEGTMIARNVVNH